MMRRHQGTRGTRLAVAAGSASVVLLLLGIGAAAEEPPAAKPTAKQALPRPSIEGTYAVEGSNANVKVERLTSDIFHLTSAGWEGVGILSGATYRGVFREGGPGMPFTAMGEQTIDWHDPDNPSMRGSYTSFRTGQIAERWHRLADSKRPAPRRGPAFGEYVYVEELPEAITKVPPVYPNEARNAGIDGVVVVQALVLEDGSVGDVRIVNSVPALDDAASACVRQWRFKPALTGGKPVAVWVAVPVRFSLH